MNKFIELESKDEKILLNLNNIISFNSSDSGSVILLSNKESIYVKEDYQQVKKLIDEITFSINETFKYSVQLGYQKAIDLLLDYDFRKENKLDGVECGICANALIEKKDEILNV